MGKQLRYFFNSINSVNRNLLATAGFGLGLLLSSPAMSSVLLTEGAYIAPADFYGTTMKTDDAPYGTGKIIVDGGSTVNMVKGSNPVANRSGPFVAIGRRNGSNGKLTVTGTGSAINMEADGSAASFQIGRDGGTGTVTVKDGGAVNVIDSSGASGSSSVSAESILIGYSVGSVGTLNIDSGSALVKSTSGASVQVGKYGSTGTINVSGTGTLSLIDTDPGLGSSFSVLTMGRKSSSNGTLAITDQGAVVVQSLNSFAGVFVGKNSSSEGLLTINGPDASLTVHSGATTHLSGSSSLVTLGRDAGTTGAMIVSGGAIAQVTGLEGNIFVGAAFADLGRTSGGTGILTVTGSGSEVLASNAIVVGSPTSLGAGTSSGIVTVTDGGTLTAKSVYIGEGGTLNGNGGTIMGDVLVDGGVLAPGNSPGVMSIDGNLNIMSGALQMEIAGTGFGQYDVLNVSGDFILDPLSPIDLIFQNFTPTVGDSFGLFNIIGDILFSNDGGETTTPGSFELLVYNVISSEGDKIRVSGSYIPGSGYALSVISAVPLPPSAILFGTALLGLAGIGRRKRNNLAA